MTTQTDLVAEAKKAVNEARRCEEWAIDAYRRAYSENVERVHEGGSVLIATKDGWDDGPLPYAIEFDESPGSEDAVFLFRDGGPTCGRFSMEAAREEVVGGVTAALGALAFVRQITYSDGRIAFLDGHQVAGLLLVALEEEN